MNVNTYMKALTAIATVSTALYCLPAFAGDPPADPTKVDNVDKKAKRPEGTQAVKQLELSLQLAQYGRANKDPLALITAAKMRQGVGFKVEDRKPNEGDSGAAAAGDGAMSIDALLKDAKDMSSNDKTIVAMADDVKASAAKGRVGGGIISLGTISGDTVHTRSITFAGGRFAEIAAAGTDNNDVVLEIFDQGGHLICRDSDPAYCPFTPAWTGPFTVKVYNTGSDGAHYRLETN